MRTVARSVLATLAVATMASASRARAQSAMPAVPPGYEAYDQAPSVGGSPGAPAPAPSGQRVVVVVPSYAPAAAPPPPAPRAVQIERSDTIRPLWLPGVIALPVTWLLTWTSAQSLRLEGDAMTYSWIPVIGPWLMLTQDLRGEEPAFVVSGVVQSAAAVMIVLGLSLRRTWIETRYEYDAPSARMSLHAVPLPGGGYVQGAIDL